MRALLALALLAPAACAGQVADYIGPREGIVAPQLARYGLNLRQTRCISEQMTRTLTPRQLRLFSRATGAVSQGCLLYTSPSPRDS